MDTFFLGNLNWLVIFCAALAYFALRALWYSKVLFADKALVFYKANCYLPAAG